MCSGDSGPNASPWRWTFLSLAIIILLVLAVKVPLLDIPFERDEGEYAYIAWRLGYQELPYRDWIDQKPPAIFWVYRLALSLPLNPIRAAHVAAMIFSAASGCALFFLARRFTDTFWAGTAGVLFALLSADPLLEGTAANTEIFMLLPLILSLLAFLSSMPGVRGRVLFMMLCGTMTGIAVAFKQVAAVNWPALVALYPVFVGRENRLRHTVSFAGWSLAGVAVIWAPLLIYFFVQGGLQDFLYHVFTHNLEYVHALPLADRWSTCFQTLATLSRSQALIWIFVAVGFAALLRSRRTKLLLFLGAWMLACLIGVSASGYYFPHYFQQLSPALALGAALGAEMLDRSSVGKRIPAAVRRAALGTGLVLLPAITFYPFLFAYTPAESAARIYPGNFFAQMPALAQRLRQVTSPEDRVFMFGADPQILFYAQRVSATRYIFLFPLYGPYSNVHEKQLSAQAEVLASRPGAALFLPNSLLFASGTDQYFTQWTESYLFESFRPDTWVALDEKGDAYLRPATGPAPPDGLQVVGALFVKK